MAAIRFPIGGRYRYYGRRPEQPRHAVIPWLGKGIKRTMETLLKFIFVAVLGVIFSVVGALVTTLFFYAGWNWGLVTAVSFAHPVTLFQAFWACLGLCSVGGMLKSGVKID